MATVDFVPLLQPITDVEPCGPDLDAAGDADYMSYVANAEGLLPQSFFKFDRKSIDFETQLARGRALLDLTRDLRLLALLAKFQVLNRDLEGFAQAVEVMSLLLRERWAEVHPQPEGDDHSVRASVLDSLDDLTVVGFPLQYIPLIETRRIGWISYRTIMIASGEAAPRAGEQKLEEAVIQKELLEADLAKLVEARDHLGRLHAGLIAICRTWEDRAGSGQAISCECVLPIVTKMLGHLETVIAKRVPMPAPEPATATASSLSTAPVATPEASQTIAEPGRIRTVADATAALAAAAGYFNAFEPSSPALLLVRQAEQLVGKSFVDVMRILVPASVEKANVRVGDQAFSLPLEKLGALLSSDGSERNGADSAERDTAAGTSAEPVVTANPQAMVPATPQTLELRPAAIESRVTRSEAVALLADVGAFYRLQEPSSPIPLLIDRARSLVERDFLYLLEHLLLPPKERGEP